MKIEGYPLNTQYAQHPPKPQEEKECTVRCVYHAVGYGVTVLPKYISKRTKGFVDTTYINIAITIKLC